MKTHQSLPDLDHLIGYDAAARILGVAVGTLYAWVHHRRIPFIRLGKRCVRFDRRVLAEFVAARAVPPCGEALSSTSST